MTRSGAREGDRRWAPWEEELVREHYPDLQKLQKLLPHLTYSAIRLKASALGIVKKRKLWSAITLKRLARDWPSHKTKDEILRAFPGRTWKEISSRAQMLGVRRPQSASGCLVTNVIRRARSKGIRAVTLDKLIGSGKCFGSANAGTGLGNISDAVTLLGGRLVIEWRPLDEV